MPALRVRCVEDSEDLLAFLRLALERMGAEVTCYRRVEDVPEDWTGVDVAIVDMILPGISGLELLERLRQDWPDVRRILATGFPHVKEIDLGDLVYARLSKPYRLAELQRVVSEA